MYIKILTITSPIQDHIRHVYGVLKWILDLLLKKLGWSCDLILTFYLFTYLK
jgi:hypothetical protein